MAGLPPLPARVAQILYCGFADGARPPLFDGQPAGGYIAFARNLGGKPDCFARLVRAAVPTDGIAPFIGIDQEGGRVMRLRSAPFALPSQRELTAGSPQQLTDRVRAAGAALAASGFSMNFSPVLDVDSRPDNPVIGDRSFSADPKVVALYGRAAVLGWRWSGLVPCGKHFPGHGDTDLDSHLDLPRVAAGPELLRRREIAPFAACLNDPGLPAVMTAHVVYPELDPDLPATLSPAIVRPLLLGELAFGGIVVSDDLEMRAIADRHAPEEIARLGLMAGLSMFMICHTADLQQRIFRELLRLAEHEPWARAAVDDACRRVVTVKRRWLVD